MAEEPIKHDEIIEDKVFQPTIDQANLLSTALEQVILQFKNLATTTGQKVTGINPKTISDLEALTRAEKQLSEIEKGNAEARKQYILVQEKIRILRQNERDVAKATISAYSALALQYKEAAAKAKDLAAAQGINSKAAREAAIEAKNLNDKLKAIDSSIGNNQRNVGNYTQGLKDLAGQLGITLGVSSIIAFGKASIEAFAEAQQNAHQLEMAVKNIAGEGEGSFRALIKLSEELQDKGIFSDDDIQKASTMAIQFGLNGKAVEELLPKVADFAAATGQDLNTALESVLKGISGQGRALKLYGIEVDKTGDKQKGYSTILEQLNKFQGANEQQLDTIIGKTKRFENAIDDLKEAIGEDFIKQGNKFLDFIDLVKGKLTIDDLGARQLSELIGKANEQILAKVQAGNEETKKEALNASTERIKILKDEIKGATTERTKGILVQLEQEKKLRQEINKIKFEGAVVKGGDDKEKKEKTNDFIKDVELRAKIAKEDNDRMLEYIKNLRDAEKQAAKEKEDEDERALALALIYVNRRKKEREDEAKELKQLAQERLELAKTIEQSLFEIAKAGLSDSEADLKKKKQIAQLEAAVNLANAFITSYQKYAEKDPKTAFNKAAHDIFLAKIFSKALAGNFAEGVENFQGKGTGKSDSNIIGFSHGESVLTAKGTAETRGLATSVNEQGFKGAQLWAMDNIFPQLKIDESKSNQMNKAVIKLLSHKLDALQETVKNKKETHIKWDEFNQMVKKEIEDGISRKITYMNAHIIKRSN